MGVVHINTDGSADLGMMQVNTIWVGPLSRFTHMQPQVVVDRLLNDPCFNIAASAAIMQSYLAEAHGNLLTAIGYYHSHSPSLSAGYRDKVIAAASALFSRPRKQ